MTNKPLRTMVCVTVQRTCERLIREGAKYGDGDNLQILHVAHPGQALMGCNDDPGALEAFSRLSPDMPSDSLAYAVLADRTLWGGEDLRALDGLEESMAANMAMVASMAAREEEK